MTAPRKFHCFLILIFLAMCHAVFAPRATAATVVSVDVNILNAGGWTLPAGFANNDVIAVTGTGALTDSSAGTLNGWDTLKALTGTYFGLILNNTGQTDIPDYAMNNPYLTSLEAQNVSTVGDLAFFNCDSLASVNLPLATSIGVWAFAGCDSLASVSLPSATSIGDSAFADCDSLASVSLPLATSIGEGAFFDCDSLASVSLPSATSIGDLAFYSCDSLASVSLPSATSIGDLAFYSCSLASVNLPLATSIGDWAFAHCYSLASVSLPLATSIGGLAFYSCDSLASVNLPLVTSIGDYAFAFCVALTTLSLPSATLISDDVFNNSPNLAEVAMPPTPSAFGTQTLDPPAGAVFIVPKTAAYEAWAVPAGTSWVKEYIAPSGTTSVAIGGNINLSCQTITTTTGMTYQWQKNVSGTWTDIPGETGVAYAISGAALTDSGEYRVHIDYKGTIFDTDPIAVTVGAAPTPTPTPIEVMKLWIPFVIYDGSPHAPEYALLDPMDRKTLFPGTDYDVTGGEARTEGGSYSLTVTGRGAYSGTTTSYFFIAKRPENVSAPSSASALASAVNSGSFGLHAAANGGVVTITNGGGEAPRAVSPPGGELNLDTVPGVTILWGANLTGSSRVRLVSVNGGGNIKIISGGSIINGADGGTALYSEGGVSVEGGLVSSNGRGGTAVFSFGDVTMTGGRVLANGYAGSAADAYGRFEFSGGVITAGGEYGTGIFAARGAVLSGGAVSAGQSGAAALSLTESGIKFEGGIMTDGARGEARGGALLTEDYEVLPAAALYIPSGAVVTNKAVMTVNGAIIIERGGKLENYGKITGIGSIENNGELNNHGGASVNVSVSGGGAGNEASNGGGGCDTGAVGLLGAAALAMIIRKKR
ncbi:hypothetical protein FACS1894167_14490 [Synergistales bacterium]|nr:hypothetical protein FACS1894167_14490 [Synergistales bacterium]